MSHYCNYITFTFTIINYDCCAVCCCYVGILTYIKQYTLTYLISFNYAQNHTISKDVEVDVYIMIMK